MSKSKPITLGAAIFYGGLIAGNSMRLTASWPITTQEVPPHILHT